MMKYIRILVCGIALQCSALPASANWLYTPGAGPSAFRSFNSGTTPAGTSACAAANTDCLANVPIDITGTPLFSSGNPGVVSGGPFAVTGTFFQATQPISAASLPLPAGAATQTTLASVLSALGSPFQAGGSIGNTSFAATQATAANLNATVVGTGTFATQAAQSGTWNVTNISGTVSLPTGASTAAKQPALGTAGTASSDVITVQGITSMTPLLATVTGSVTANAGTNLNTSALSTSANQTNASQKTQIVDGSGNVIASTSNNLNVQCANCSGSGVSAADAATFTAGTSLFAPVGGQFTSGGATACVTGHECTAGITAARALFSDTSSIAGTATLTGNGTAGAGAQRVTIASDNTAFAVNATLQASATTAIGKVDPNTSASWGLGAFASAMPANGQGIGLYDGTNMVRAKGDETNGLWVNIKAGAGSGGTAIADGATFTVGTTNETPAACTFVSGGITVTTGKSSVLSCDANGNLKVVGTGISENTAVGSLTFSGLGAEGLSAEKTAVTTGSYGRLVSDLVGKLVVMPYAPNQLWVKGTTAAMTGTTSTQLIAAVASNRIYLTTLTCGNSHATVGTFVNVQDGSGGSTLWTVPASAVYGGTTLNFQPPIPTTSGNGVYVVDATTGANVICSGSGYSGA